MTPLTDDELLTAYLDGELAADERARVERLLAEQPESRQLLEELRAVKQRLESMPAARLGDDFAERVLRQAEREVLTGGTTEGLRVHGSTEGFRVQGSGFSERAEAFRGQDSEHNSWQRLRRPLIWASLALAAGLLIMFVDRDRQKPKQVALVPERPEMHDRSGLARDAEMGAAPASGLATENAPAGPAGSEPSVEWNSFRFDDDENGMNSVPRGENGMNSVPRGKNGTDSVPRTDEASRLSRGRSAPAAGRRLMDQLDESASGETAELKQNAEPMGELFGLRESLARDATVIDDQTLVVWCEVSPDGPPEESFSRLLAEQNIALGPPGEVAEPLGAKLGAGAAGKAETFYYQAELEDLPAIEVDARQLVSTLRRRGLRRADKDQKDQKSQSLAALESPGAQMVLVEATDQQVKAVLEAIDQDRDTYRTVDVEPAPKAPSQQSLSQYSRGAVNVKKEASKRFGGMSVQNSAADQRLPQGRALRLQLQSGVQPAETQKADLASPPPPAPAPAEAGTLDVRAPKSAAAREQEIEPTYRVLFVLVPPTEEAAKPAAKVHSETAAPDPNKRNADER